MGEWENEGNICCDFHSISFISTNSEQFSHPKWLDEHKLQTHLLLSSLLVVLLSLWKQSFLCCQAFNIQHLILSHCFIKVFALNLQRQLLLIQKLYALFPLRYIFIIYQQIFSHRRLGSSFVVIWISFSRSHFWYASRMKCVEKSKHTKQICDSFSVFVENFHITLHFQCYAISTHQI